MNEDTRPIPTQMWDELADADERASHEISGKLAAFRAEAIHIGRKYGFNEAALIARGIITPETRTPSPDGKKRSKRE